MLPGMYNPAAGGVGTFKFTITANQLQINLAAYATLVGWNGIGSLEVTVAAGVYLWSDSTAVAGVTTGVVPNGATLINNGYIMGRGGDTATAGGPAISLGSPMTLNTGTGYIGGGGGWGAAGGGTGGGAAGKAVALNGNTLTVVGSLTQMYGATA